MLERVRKISDHELCDMLGLLGTIVMHEQTREEFNIELAQKLESGEIDEIELIIIESGM